jgi:hypothetical protein
LKNESNRKWAATIVNQSRHDEPEEVLHCRRQQPRDQTGIIDAGSSESLSTWIQRAQPVSLNRGFDWKQISGLRKLEATVDAITENGSSLESKWPATELHKRKLTAHGDFLPGRSSRRRLFYMERIETDHSFRSSSNRIGPSRFLAAINPEGT